MNKETTEKDDGMVEVNVPFMGFYETYAGEALKLFTENDCYNVSEPILVKMQEFDRWSDTRECMELVAKTYTDDFFANLNAELAQEGLPPIIPNEYSGLSSPREYNFETDRLFAKVPKKIMVDYWHRILGNPDLRARLKKYLTDTFKSRSGFISFYDSTVEEWEAKDPNGFDNNEFGAIIAVLAQSFFSEDWEMWAVTEGCSECKYRVSWGEKADKIRDEIWAMQDAENN
jgi:hypothetical protein